AGLQRGQAGAESLPVGGRTVARLAVQRLVGAARLQPGAGAGERRQGFGNAVLAVTGQVGKAALLEGDRRLFGAAGEKEESCGGSEKRSQHEGSVSSGRRWRSASSSDRASRHRGRRSRYR